MEERKRNWKEIRKFEEILFEEYNGIAKITINRPQYRNAFTPLTTKELSDAFALCREMQRIRVVLLTGAMSPVPEGMRAEADTSIAQARHRHGERLCHRRGTCVAPGVRPDDSIGERHLRTDGAEGGLV